MKLILGSEGFGFNTNWKTGDVILLYLLKKLYPHAEIEQKNTADCDFIISSHFNDQEPLWNTKKKKYIYWSGESYEPIPSMYESRNLYITTTCSPLLNHMYTPYALYSPHLYKPRKYVNNNRPYLLAYCSSHLTFEREHLFNLFVEKSTADQCHSYGKCRGKYPHTQQGMVGGGWQGEELIDTYKNYNFVITVENTNVDGYVTEKIINAFYSGAIPIFWGSSKVNDLFNEKAFINVNNFKTFEACVDHVLRMSKQDIKNMMREPIYKDNDLAHLLDDEYNKKGNPLLNTYLNQLKIFLD